MFDTVHLVLSRGFDFNLTSEFNFANAKLNSGEMLMYCKLRMFY